MLRALVLVIVVTGALAIDARDERATLALSVPGELDIIAGGSGNIGDGGPAIDSPISADAMAFGPGGAIYVGDAAHCRIRQIAAGIVTTIAGDGTCATSPDGLAIQPIQSPRDIDVDDDGNVLFTDDCRIRRITAGSITTIADLGSSGCIDVRIAAHGSDVYVSRRCRIELVSGGSIIIVAGIPSTPCGTSPDGAPAVGSLIRPVDIAVDPSGDPVFVEDFLGSCRIRKVSGGILTTIVAVGDGTISPCTSAGDGGSATAATITIPANIAYAPNGDLVISEASAPSCRIRVVSGGTITTLYNNLCGRIAVDSVGDVYVGRTTGYYGEPNEETPGGYCNITRLSTGVLYPVAGPNGCHFYGEGIDAEDATFGHIKGIAADPTGDIFLLDAQSCRVRRISAGIVTTFFQAEELCALASESGTMTFGAAGDLFIGLGEAVYLLSDGVLTLHAGGLPCGTSPTAGDGGPATNIAICDLEDFHYDAPSGDLYIADGWTCVLRKITAGGSMEVIAGDGTCAHTGDGGSATDAQLGKVDGVTMDASGNIYISSGSCTLRRIDPLGNISTVAGVQNPYTFNYCFPGAEPSAMNGAPALRINPRTGPLEIHPSGGVLIRGATLQHYADGGLVSLTSELSLPSFPGPSGDPLSIYIGAGAFALGPGGDIFLAMGDRLARINSGGAADTDADGVPDYADNCTAIANANQLNLADRDFVASSIWQYHDHSRPHSDRIGDACDPDDDNDGLSDVEELAGCPSSSGPTDPMLADTDGDLVLDGAECALGYDPANAASTPPKSPNGDSDGDGAPDAFEVTIGTNPNHHDSDDDGVQDGLEVMGHNTNPLLADTDGDGCHDGKEIASLDPTDGVNSGDQLRLSNAYGPSSGPKYEVNFDLNRDGAINSGDQLFMAMHFGPC